MPRQTLIVILSQRAAKRVDCSDMAEDDDGIFSEMDFPTNSGTGAEGARLCSRENSSTPDHRLRLHYRKVILAGPKMKMISKRHNEKIKATKHFRAVEHQASIRDDIREARAPEKRATTRRNSSF